MSGKEGRVVLDDDRGVQVRSFGGSTTGVNRAYRLFREIHEVCLLPLEPPSPLQGSSIFTSILYVYNARM